MKLKPCQKQEALGRTRMCGPAMQASKTRAIILFQRYFTFLKGVSINLGQAFGKIKTREARQPDGRSLSIQKVSRF